MVYFPNLLFLNKNKADEMQIKDGLVLNGMTLAEADKIEYNTISVFQNINSNMPGYYIV